jgi:ribonuclease HI
MKTKKANISRGAEAEPGTLPIRIYTDGAGARPDGIGSGFAWVYEGSGKKDVQRKDGLTNNEAEYTGLLSAIRCLPNGAQAEILTDSTLMWGQFSGKYKVKVPALVKLLAEVRQVIQQKNLTVTVTWIPREENLAGRLL